MSQLLSYIIPFYNGENTILRSLDSIYAIGLDYDDFEVIVVDDCSPIRADYVLEDYCQKYSNLRIIRHDINKRQGGAKNTGIRAAIGEFIAFADQDDEVLSANVKGALECAVTNHVDMLSCRYSVKYEDSTIKEFGINSNDGLLVSGKEFCEQHFDSSVCLAPWAYLYRRKFLYEINRPYEENVVMEDADWIAWHLIHAKKIAYYKHSIYYWIMNPDSITHSVHYVNHADRIKYGYRKIRDAKLCVQLSPVFSTIMREDGKTNIQGNFKKLWKTDSYSKFYEHLGIETLSELKKMDWKQPAKGMILHPTLTCITLSIMGPILKFLNIIRYAFKNLAKRNK